MTTADERVDEIHVEPIENTDRVKATINGVEVAAEQVRVTGPEVVFIADDASVARVETTRPPGTFPNIVCRALVHGETAIWTANVEKASRGYPPATTSPE